MSRTPARVTQADVARAIRAAKQAGAGTVRILPDGTIAIDVQPANAVEPQENAIAPEREIIL
jgi:hypothetical protein